MTKIYLDSNIIFAKAADPEKEPIDNPIAEKIFEKIKNEDIKVVISNLTLMEIRAVLRSREGSKVGISSRLSDSEKADHVLKESNKSFNDILGSLLLMKDKAIFKVDGEIDMNAILNDSMMIIDHVRGKVKTRRCCKKCGSDRSFTSYKSLDTYDAFHVLLAKKMGCDEFWTFDGDFDEIKEHEKILPLKIRNARYDLGF